MKLRGLVLVLVCLNLGAALWWALHAPPAAAPMPQPVPGVARLQLLAERGEAPAPLPVRQVGVCLSLGPFLDAEAYRAALHVLSPQVERIQLRELPSTQLLGYRVYLPPAASREAASALTKTLMARGVRDYYLVSAGPQKHSISLGLFRDLGNAERRRDQLKALGFAVVLEPRSDSSLQWWIDVVAAPGFDWRAALPAAPGLQARGVECSGVEAPPPAEPAAEAAADAPAAAAPAPAAGPIR